MQTSPSAPGAIPDAFLSKSCSGLSPSVRAASEPLLTSSSRNHRMTSPDVG